MKKLLLLLIAITVLTSVVNAQNHARKIKSEINKNFVDSEQIIPLLNKNTLLSTQNDFGDAPDWNWSGQFGGSGNDYARDIVTDNIGNTYITGSFSGQISIDAYSFSSVGNRDAIVVKFDSNGNLIWVKQIPASENETIDAYGICLDEPGNIFITGYYTGSVILGGISLPDNAVSNLYFAKLNTTGDVVMAKNHGEGEQTEIGLRIDTDNNDNIYVLGSTDGTIGYRHPTIVLKYDNDANLISNYLCEENIIDFKVFNSGIYYCGTVLDDGYIGNFYLDPEYGNDAYTAKSDLDFNFEWVSMAAHVYNYGSSYSYAQALYVNSNEDIFVTGHYRSNVIFADTLTESHNFATKCNSTGEYIWANNVPDPSNYWRSNCDIHGSDSKLFVKNVDVLSEFNAITGDLLNSTTLDYEPDKIYCDHLNNKILTIGNHNQLIYVSQLNEQLNEQWLAQFGGNSGSSHVIGTVTDNSGNLYVFAYASAEMDYFGETVGKGSFLCKQKWNGEVLWIKQFDDLYINATDGNPIEIDPSNNNIFITGNFTNSLSIPGGPTLTAADEGSVFIINYDTEGNYVMNVQEDSQKYISGLCLAGDYSGNIILSGTFYNIIHFGNTTLSSEGSSDVFISKYNSNGEFIWAKRGGGEDTEYIGLISVDENNNIYLTGEFLSDNVSIGDGQITLAEGDGNIVLAKLTPDGSVLWIKSYAGSNIEWGDHYSWPSGIKTDKQGNSYIKGWHGDSTYFDNIMLRSPYYSFSKFITKINTMGNVIWVNSITEHKSGSNYNQMDIDSEGNVYWGSQIRDTVHFGDDFTYINSGLYDLVIAKYSSGGGLNWVKTIQSTTGLNRISSVSVADTNVFVGGYFNNFISFDGNILYSNNTHGFIALMRDNLDGVIEVYNSEYYPINTYPNPFNTSTTFQIIDNEHLTQTKTISIYNSQLQLVKQIQWDKNQLEVIFKKENLKSGMYYYRVILESNKTIGSGKIIVID